MSHRVATSLVFGTLLSLCLSGCAGSAVPALTADDLFAPQLPLEPRQIAVAVIDERPVAEADRRKTEANVAAVLGEVFRSTGVQVYADASNSLRVTVRLPARGAGEFDAQYCIELTGELKQTSGTTLSGTSLGCYEVKSAIGISYGTDVSTSFEQATNSLLRHLQGEFFALRRLKEPPRFEASQISVPEFASLASKSLALDVRDEWSSDGALGENVREQLTKALRAKGIQVEPRAGQRLTVRLRKPDQDFEGRSRDTCLEMSLNASLQRGTAFALATACRGPDEAIHHRVLSEALNVLDTEYAKLQAHQR